MLVVFRQTYKKMIFSFATVIMFLISILIFWLFISIFKVELADTYFVPQIAQKTLSSILLTYFRMFLIFLFPIYISINTVKFISDELESGAFLTILSKPISRFNIIAQKFAALIFTNMSFCIGMLGFIWFYILNITLSAELYDIMFTAFPTILAVSFIIQLVLSIVLAIISIKFNALLMLGIGIGFALVSQMWPTFNSNNIANNRLYQAVGGRLFSEARANIVIQGQKNYKRFIRPFSFVDHMNQLYWEDVARAYAKYRLSDAVRSRGEYNREAIIKSRFVERKDNLNNIIKEKKYYVAAVKPWINHQRLKIYYTIASISLIIYGLYYFNKKDIV